MMRIRRGLWALLAAAALLTVCGGPERSVPYDSNTAVPEGDPPFTPLGESWVIDRAGLLSEDVIRRGDAICQALQDDGIAEMVVLLQPGVGKPELYATHYGRWLGLGKAGASTAGGNNGLVWLIRPDAAEKMTISVGRGLPRFTSSDYGPIMDKAKDYLNFNNFDKGLLILIEETDRTLRSVYEKNKGG